MQDFVASIEPSKDTFFVWRGGEPSAQVYCCLEVITNTNYRERWKRHLFALLQHFGFDCAGTQVSHVSATEAKDTCNMNIEGLREMFPKLPK